MAEFAVKYHLRDKRNTMGFHILEFNGKFEFCFQIPSTESTLRNTSACGDVWIEYHELNWDDVEEIARGELYNADDVVNLMRKVAPKLMARGDENWGFGIADDLSDKKYQHHRYWSNPLETT